MTTALGVFPNVPDLPGVPPLQRKITTNAIAAVPLLLKGILPQSTVTSWGVFDSKGKLFLEPDSFLGIRYRNANRVSDYPVEQGAFSTYNKVQTPFDATVSLGKGGTIDERTQFMLKVEQMFSGTDLYTLITPELTYPDVTIERHDYERQTKNGAHFIVAHIHFIQVRQVPNPGVYSQPTATTAAHRGNVGAVSPLSTILAASALTPILDW